MEILALIAPLILIMLTVLIIANEKEDAAGFALGKMLKGAIIGWAIGIVLLCQYFSQNFTIENWHTELVCSVLLLAGVSALGVFLSWMFHRRTVTAKMSGCDITPEMVWWGFFKIYLRMVLFTFLVLFTVFKSINILTLSLLIPIPAVYVVYVYKRKP